MASSKVQASPPNDAFQLFGESRQMYQSRLAQSREDRESTNHGCSAEVWLGTQSTITRMPRRWASASTRSKSSRVPNTGSTSQKSVTS